MRRPRLRGGEKGYVLVAAAATLALFAALALSILAAGQGQMSGLSADVTRARLKAAAEAGVAIAIQGVSVADRAQRWPIDGRPASVPFNGVSLTISVEDENGKLALNRLDKYELSLLLQAAKIDDAQAAQIGAAFHDWMTPPADVEVQPGQIAPRGGQFWTVDELMQLPGMDRAVFDRIAPALTVFPGSSINKQAAHPLALAVWSGVNSPDVIARQRELNGQRTALDIADDLPMSGRALTVRVRAEDGQGGRYDLAEIIEFTSNDMTAWRVRMLE